MRKFAVISFAIIFCACTTPSYVEPLSVPLAYKTMASGGEFPSLGACASLGDVRVTDARADKALGKRFVEGKNTPAAPVTTESDVAAWVREGAIQALTRSGGSVGKSGGPVLRLTIEQISTSENVLHRSGYEGRIAVTAELVGKDGRSCWKDRLDGFAENYGYAGSVENYQETLNHALDRAMIRMLSSAQFKDAVCSC